MPSSAEATGRFPQSKASQTSTSGSPLPKQVLQQASPCAVIWTVPCEVILTAPCAATWTASGFQIAQQGDADDPLLVVSGGHESWPVSRSAPDPCLQRPLVVKSDQLLLASPVARPGPRLAM